MWNISLIWLKYCWLENIYPIKNVSSDSISLIIMCTLIYCKFLNSENVIWKRSSVIYIVGHSNTIDTYLGHLQQALLHLECNCRQIWLLDFPSLVWLQSVVLISFQPGEDCQLCCQLPHWCQHQQNGWH